MKNHEMFHATFEPLVGQQFTTASAKSLIASQFPQLNPGSNIPTDHSYNAQGNIYCPTCRANGALFARNGSLLTVAPRGMVTAIDATMDASPVNVAHALHVAARASATPETIEQMRQRHADELERAENPARWAAKQKLAVARKALEAAELAALELETEPEQTEA